MERKNLTRWAVYQSDVKYKLWNAKNFIWHYQTYNVRRICQTAKLHSKKVEEFFCRVCKLLTSGILTKSH